MENNDFKTDIDPVAIAETLEAWEVTNLSVDENGFHFIHRGREAHIRLGWAIEIDEGEGAPLEHGECFGAPQSAVEVLYELLHRYRHPPVDAKITNALSAYQPMCSSASAP